MSSGDRGTARTAVKALAFAMATLCILPLLASYRVRALLLGADRALEGSTQLLALIPGLAGQYLRRAFLARVLRECARSATIEFGTLFSQADARIGEYVYVGPHCHLGLVHLERNVMLAAGVHVPSGRSTHGFSNLHVPMREQPGARRLVHIGKDTWVGSAAVVMADVGEGSIVGAGAVVTAPVPPRVIVGGVPARIIRDRATAPSACGRGSASESSGQTADLAHERWQSTVRGAQ